MSDEQDDRARLAELGLLTAGLTHELRQPLFAMRSLVQLLQVRTGGEQAKLITELLSQTQLMGEIIDGVGTYARRADSACAPVDTGAVAREAIQLLRHRAKTRQATLELAQTAATQAARADHVGLLQVLVNVVNNAIDACRTRVVVHCRDAADGLELVVEDDGAGIPDEVLARVFEPLFTTKAPGQGTGLGLSIARKMVRSWGGELTLQTSPQGTVVTVRLAPWT